MPNASYLRQASVSLIVLAACATSTPPPERQAAPPAAAQAAAPSNPAPALPSAIAAAPQPSSPSVLPPDTLAGPAADRVSELATKAAPLVDAFLNLNGLFTRDGKRVLITSNRDGLPQLYIANAARPDSPARRLVELRERVRLDTTTPDGKAVLFGSDHGADEKWSIWRVNVDD